MALTVKSPVKPTRVRCWNGFAFGNRAVSIGQIVTTDNPLYAAAPGNFVDVDELPENVPSLYREAIAENNRIEEEKHQRALAEAAANRVQLPKPQVFRTTRDVRVNHVDGRLGTLEKGSFLTADHPMFSQVPADAVEDVT
jgi:hypothetical protein